MEAAFLKELVQKKPHVTQGPWTRKQCSLSVTLASSMCDLVFLISMLFWKTAGIRKCAEGSRPGSERRHVWPGRGGVRKPGR